MCPITITSLYDVAKIILGCSLPMEYEFVYVIFTLVMAIVLVACVFAPFWLLYKLFN